MIYSFPTLFTIRLFGTRRRCEPTQQMYGEQRFLMNKKAP
ncbi:hypothetical protein BOVA604_3739 [Bacteroides ovatus]|nr:hypothetical protein BOVA604_3739 [Bacteroides ovatus]